MMKMISENLELSNTKSTIMVAPTWTDDCQKERHRVRCDTQEIATVAFNHIQYALHFYTERKHMVQSVENQGPLS